MFAHLQYKHYAHPEIEEIVIWTDGCTYQNRNTNLANSLLDLAIKRGVKIVQKYLVVAQSKGSWLVIFTSPMIMYQPDWNPHLMLWSRCRMMKWWSLMVAILAAFVLERRLEILPCTTSGPSSSSLLAQSNSSWSSQRRQPGKNCHNESPFLKSHSHGYAISKNSCQSRKGSTTTSNQWSQCYLHGHIHFMTICHTTTIKQYDITA